MTTNDKAKRLAELKSIIKSLTTEASLITKDLVLETDEKKIETEYGTLSLTTRTTYECTDKQKTFVEMGSAEYVAISTITLPAIRKALGSFRATMFEKAGLFKVKSVSKYYTLR